jgi:ribosomal protein L34
MRVTAGGGIDWDHRAAAARGREIVDRSRTNLLGLNVLVCGIKMQPLTLVASLHFVATWQLHVEFHLTYPGSSMRVTAGGGIDWDHRAAAARGREIVDRSRSKCSR